MKNVSMHKLSLLGLVLLVASAVTAAVIPKDRSNKYAAPGNRIDNSTGCAGQKTCIPAAGFNQCIVTAGTKTSCGEDHSSYTTNKLAKLMLLVITLSSARILQPLLVSVLKF